MEAKPRAPAVRAARVGDPAAARARQRREDTRGQAPRAPQGRRVASLVRTTPAVRELIKADAERRAPQHRQPVGGRLDGALGLWHLATKLLQSWQRVTCVLAIRHVVSSLCTAAHAFFQDGSQVGTRGVQVKRADRLRGRVGAVIGSLRQMLTRRRRQAGRETRATVITCLHTHRRWRLYDADPAAGVPVGTGVVESACGAVVKPRMAGAGKRWSLEGAEAMRAWRSLKQSHDHDRRDDWRFRARQVRVRLYGHQPQSRPTARLRRVA